MSDNEDKDLAEVESSLREKEDALTAEIEQEEEVTRLKRVRRDRIRAAREALGGEPVKGQRRQIKASRSTSGKSRKDEFLDRIIEAGPDGTTVSESANAMGTAAGYLYKLRDQLVEEELIRVEGKKLIATQPDKV